MLLALAAAPTGSIWYEGRRPIAPSSSLECGGKLLCPIREGESPSLKAPLPPVRESIDATDEREEREVSGP
jgi:hypothetical protein